jgi:hypothetical protein
MLTDREKPISNAAMILATFIAGTMISNRLHSAGYPDFPQRNATLSAQSYRRHCGNPLIWINVSASPSPKGTVAAFARGVSKRRCGSSTTDRRGRAPCGSFHVRQDIDSVIVTVDHRARRGLGFSRSASSSRSGLLFERISNQLAGLMQGQYDDTVDMVFVVPDNKREPIFALVDSKRRGKPDGIIIYSRQSGKWTTSVWDVNLDGTSP